MDGEREKLLKELGANPSLLVPTELDLEAKKLDLMEKREKALSQIREQAEIRKMRKRWSNWLLACIVGIVILDFVFVFKLGSGSLFFTDDKIVIAFIADNLIKISGLSLLVVNYLFDRNIKK